ncbi:MAG: response regulator transcription factor [Acidobacteriales bacterium]|nr:response regulator transcription factor [Terriglobales bacterium]
MSSKKILLVEDEAGLVLTLTDRLEMQGYAVESAADGAAGLEKALANSYDLIILDVMLPQMNGFEVCRKLREHGSMVPILMLTARAQLADKVHGLKTGADDYLTKPFEVMELLARLEALLRRAPQASVPEALRFGPAEVDFKRGEARVNGAPVSLSAREFQLLRYLAERRGEVVSRAELLKDVWGYTCAPLTRTVDVHITWLRQKLEEDPKHPRHILTLRGAGYKLA